MNLVITISGLHGTGKSTIARAISKAFNLRHISAGDLFRQIAFKRGLTVSELSKLSAKNRSVDDVVDERTRSEAKRGSVVLDGLLTGWLAKDHADLKIFLVASETARITRIAGREGISYNTAREATLQRLEPAGSRGRCSKRPRQARQEALRGTSSSTRGLSGLARNPIISHVFTADPSARAFEGRICVYASHDLDDQAGYDMLDYHVFSSNDLVNWQDHGVALDVDDISWARRLYAPDCAYSEVTGKYYLYFPNAGSNIGVAVSDSPSGPFVDAFKPALGGICLALVLAALAVMRLGDWSRYGTSLLIIGIVFVFVEFKYT